MNNTASKHAGRFALSAVTAATLALAVGNSWAVGLGRVAVQSALGENLRAEIDITSLTPEEAASLRVRIAPPEAYRAAGVEYSGVLPGAQVTVARRSDGGAYVRVVGERTVQEPFVDLILEVTWSSGRLVREYTLLLDPPGSRAAAAPAPVAPAMSAAPAPAPAQAPAQTPAAAAPATPRTAAARPAATAPAPSPAAGATARRASGAVDEYQVRAGDTLYRAAVRTQREGVSLDQMLVALFRANPQAFMGENMNRLKAGSTLTVPQASAIKEIAPGDARQVIQAQSADFGTYRERLAAGVPAVKGVEPARQATGKVQAQVDDKKAPAAASPDKLKLSQGAVKSGAAASEVKVSKESEQKAQTARVAELSRNVQELQKIKEGASAVAAVKPAAPAPAPAPAAAQASAPAVAPAIQVPAPAPAPAPTATAPSPAPAMPASAPPQAASRPAVAAKPPAGQPVEEPSLLTGLLDNPFVLPGAGIVVALLAGLGFYRWRNRARTESGETSFLESRLQPDSFFGASGGQRIDTRDASGASSSMSYSLSQLDAIGDVDPVAEADVYLAYGRDLQAEEILKEAMRSNPDRLAIRTKLLEVYAKRRDTKGFELLATQLYALTHGEGDDWFKAQELGQQIDPENDLYRPGGTPVAMATGSGAAIVEALGASTMPQSVMPPSSTAFAASDSPAPSADDMLDLDLDLVATPASKSPSPMESTQPLQSLDDLPDTPALPEARPASESAAMEFDLGGISLDLGAPAAAPKAEAGVDLPSTGEADAPLDASDPLARKLELAEEFRQIGDMEGARDLLEEVVAKASGALKARAQGLLDSLA